MKPGLLLAVILAFSGWAPAQTDVEKARAFMKQGSFNEARAMWEKVMTAEGRTYRTLMGVAKALFAQRESGRAGSLFAEAEAIKPSMAEPILYQALLAERASHSLLERQMPAWRQEALKAIELFDAASRKDDGVVSFKCHYWTAEGYRLLGRPMDAIVAIRKAIQIDAEHEGARGLELRLLLEAGRLQELARATMPNEKRVLSAEDLLLRLMALARLKMVDDAAGLFRQLQSPDSLGDDPRIWMVVFQAWSGVNERQYLESLLSDSRVQATGGSLLSYFKGEFALVKGDPVLAAREFASYVKQVPSDPAGRSRWLSSLLEAGQVADADDVVRDSLIVLGAEAELLGMGQRVVKVWVDQKDFDRALKLQTALLELSPDDLGLLQGQGALLKENGKLSQCEALLRGVLSRDDLDTMARSSFLNDLALCIKGAGRMEEAMALFRQSADQTAFSLDARENLATLLQSMGKSSLALELIREVLLIEPDRPRARYYSRVLNDEIR